MRFCRGFICFLNSEIRLECALFVPYRPKKCFTRRPDAHIFSGKQAIKKRTCRRPLKCCSQAVSTARKVLCTSCIASRYCDYVSDALRKRELVGAWPLHLADARPFRRLKAPLGLSLLRCAAQTRTFENTSLSAACKKTQGKLWQKERGPDGAGPLDRIMRCSKTSAAFIAVFKNSAEQNGIFTICSLRILLRWENRIRQKDKVSAGKIRTRR